jgi:hypothetical protein
MAANVKPGDARPSGVLGHWAGAATFTSLNTAPGQYITTWSTPLSVGAVQGDLNTGLGRPVKARVRQARVLRRSAQNNFVLSSPSWL